MGTNVLGLGEYCALHLTALLYLNKKSTVAKQGGVFEHLKELLAQVCTRTESRC